VNVHLSGFGTASCIAAKSILGVYSKVVERNDIHVFTRGIQKYVPGCEFDVGFRFLVEKL
jgi:hypothetical protein